MNHPCERCNALPTGPFQLFDYCPTCGKDRCPTCAREGCCGEVPMLSGMEADYQADALLEGDEEGDEE